MKQLLYIYTYLALNSEPFIIVQDRQQWLKAKMSYWVYKEEEGSLWAQQIFQKSSMKIYDSDIA